MKLLCWNVNGIRAAGRGGFLDWFKEQDADIVGVQEIKAFPGQVEPALRNPEGRLAFWHPAKKPGYSGVAAFTRIEPLNVIYGIGHSEIDDDGRVLQLEFKDFIYITSYFPNSQRDAARLGFKLEFCREMLKLLESGHALACVRRLRAEGLHHGVLPLLDVILEQPHGERFIEVALANTDERVRAGKSVSPGFL
jgi:exodeoxyribonuclease-3